MNREIKFRAWDKLHDHMIDWEQVTYGQRFDTTYFHPNYADQLILMQYTGLKDKNGTEIYEGDIVRYYWKSILDSKQKPVDELSTVVFVGGSFRVKENGGFIRKEHQVIGNIYENPELLKGHNETI